VIFSPYRIKTEFQKFLEEEGEDGGGNVDDEGEDCGGNVEDEGDDCH